MSLGSLQYEPHSWSFVLTLVLSAPPHVSTYPLESHQAFCVPREANICSIGVQLCNPSCSPGEKPLASKPKANIGSPDSNKEAAFSWLMSSVACFALERQTQNCSETIYTRSFQAEGAGDSCFRGTVNSFSVLLCCSCLSCLSYLSGECSVP